MSYGPSTHDLNDAAGCFETSERQLRRWISQGLPQVTRPTQCSDGRTRRVTLLNLPDAWAWLRANVLTKDAARRQKFYKKLTDDLPHETDAEKLTYLDGYFAGFHECVWYVVDEPEAHRRYKNYVYAWRARKPSKTLEQLRDEIRRLNQEENENEDETPTN